MSKYQSVSNLLTQPGNNLQLLLERARYLQSLTRVLREHIDPVLSDHISVVNLRHDSAIIAADSSAWLSKIRYLTPVILQILQAQPGLTALSNIQLKVQPISHAEPSIQTRRQLSLSASSTKALVSAASGINDPELAESLRRLSRKGKP